MCSNESGRDYHPDERKANQKIVHLSVSPWAFFSLWQVFPVHI
jgi:hypothetical protein